MIKISVSKREVTGHEGVMKCYASAQIEQTMDLNQFAEHIASHGSVFTRDVVHGVLLKMVDCMREQMLEGKSIRLGDLGCFRLTVSNANYKKLPNDIEDYIPQSHISKVNVAWTRGSKFKDLKKDAKFSITTTRFAQQQVLDAIKEGSETVDLKKPEKV